MVEENVLIQFPINANTVAKFQLGVLDRFVIVYVGSFGGWYLTDEILDFYETAREFIPNAFALVLTQTKLDIKSELATRGYTESDMLVTQVEADEIPVYVPAGDVALSIIKPCYSKIASSPTKIAEYLACGVPVISNKGIGDVDELITKHKVGSLLDDLSPASYRKALREVLNCYPSGSD